MQKAAGRALLEGQCQGQPRAGNRALEESAYSGQEREAGSMVGAVPWCSGPLTTSRGTAGPSPQPCPVQSALCYTRDKHVIGSKPTF